MDRSDEIQSAFKTLPDFSLKNQIVLIGIVLAKLTVSMSRERRVLGNDITYHVVANCNAKDFLFRHVSDFLAFIRHLEKCQSALSFDLHAYCLMHSHIHLMLTTRNDVFLDKVMYEICQRFSYKYNQLYGREGHFWKNRYFAKVVDTDAYGLVCLRYLHQNPVKSGLVANPALWQWSCAKFYLSGRENPIIKPLPSYLGLATDSLSRGAIYRKWLEANFSNPELEDKLIKSKMKVGSQRFEKYLNQLLPILENIRM